MLFFIILAVMAWAGVRGWAWYAPVIAAVAFIPVAFLQYGALSGSDATDGMPEPGQIAFNLTISVGLWFAAYWLARLAKSRWRKT
jgi:hypothetical protein